MVENMSTTEALRVAKTVARDRRHIWHWMVFQAVLLAALVLITAFIDSHHTNMIAPAAIISITLIWTCVRVNRLWKSIDKNTARLDAFHAQKEDR